MAYPYGGYDISFVPPVGLGYPTIATGASQASRSTVIV